MKADLAWGAECAWPVREIAARRFRPWKSLSIALLFIALLQFGHGAWLREEALLAHEIEAPALQCPPPVRGGPGLSPSDTSTAAASAGRGASLLL